jgi:hypothetical protein
MLGEEVELRQRTEEEIERMRSAGGRIPGHQSLSRRDEALERGWVEVDDEAFERLVELAD